MTFHELTQEYREKLETQGGFVWCDWNLQGARTADGFCEFCGSNSHESYEKSLSIGGNTLVPIE